MSSLGQNSEKLPHTERTGRKPKTAKKPRTSIRRDGLHPADYFKYQLRFSCEDCTHFKESDGSCTIGYGTRWHRKAFQQEEYERTGKMALCRLMEID